MRSEGKKESEIRRCWGRAPRSRNLQSEHALELNAQTIDRGLFIAINLRSHRSSSVLPELLRMPDVACGTQRMPVR
eukprot:747574-Hanusia_phi.AAC.7